MKAIVYTRYGSPDVLHLEEVTKPVPRNNELLIRVRATTVTAGDCGRAHPDQEFMVPGHWFGDLLQTEHIRRTIPCVNDRFHGDSPTFLRSSGVR